MRYVGGYGDLLALEEDCRAYDDVLLAMGGEAEAMNIAEMQRKAKADG